MQWRDDALCHKLQKRSWGFFSKKHKHLKINTPNTSAKKINMTNSHRDMCQYFYYYAFYPILCYWHTRAHTPIVSKIVALVTIFFVEVQLVCIPTYTCTLFLSLSPSPLTRPLSLYTGPIAATRAGEPSWSCLSNLPAITPTHVTAERISEASECVGRSVCACLCVCARVCARQIDRVGVRGTEKRRERTRARERAGERRRTAMQAARPRGASRLPLRTMTHWRSNTTCSGAGFWISLSDQVSALAGGTAFAPQRCGVICFYVESTLEAFERSNLAF